MYSRRVSAKLKWFWLTFGEVVPSRVVPIGANQAACRSTGGAVRESATGPQLHLDRAILRPKTDQGHFRHVRDQASLPHQQERRSPELPLSYALKHWPERITKCVCQNHLNFAATRLVTVQAALSSLNQSRRRRWVSLEKEVPFLFLFILSC
jgi:hypothetical protein